MFPCCSYHSPLFSGLSLWGRGEGKIPCTGPLQVSQKQLLSSTQIFAALPPDPGYLGKPNVSSQYPHQAAHPAVSPPHLSEKPTDCKALMEVFLEGSHLSLLPFPCLFPLLSHVGVILALAEKLQGPISNTAQGTAAKFPPIFPRHYLIDKVAAPCPECATQPGSVPLRYDIMPALAAHASSCLQASSSTLDKRSGGELPQQCWRKITAQLLQAKIWHHLVYRAASFKLVLAVCCTKC